MLDADCTGLHPSAVISQLAEKHGNARLLKISDKLIVMLNGLKHKSKVFCGSVHGIRSNFTIQRRQIAQKLKNPRLERTAWLRNGFCWGSTRANFRRKIANQKLQQSLLVIFILTRIEAFSAPYSSAELFSIKKEREIEAFIFAFVVPSIRLRLWLRPQLRLLL